MRSTIKNLKEIVSIMDSYFGTGAFQSVLWDRSQIRDEHYQSTEELDLRAAIAAQHLELWNLSKAYAVQWANQTGEHHGTGPKISVIIPTYNRPDTLERAIKSVCNQLYRSIELVVVNDAGQSVSEVIDRYRDSLDIIEVNNPHNLYLAGTRNEGIRNATGDYINFLDDDDQIYPHHIGHLVYLAQSSGLPASQALSLRQVEGAAIPHQPGLVPQIFKPFNSFTLSVENVTPVQTVLLKRDLFDTIGYFDEDFLALEDWDQWIRLQKHTPIAQSHIITSWIETRNLPHRMSTGKRASFLGARARIYNEYSFLSESESESKITTKQQITLRGLAHATYEEITANQSLTLGLLGPNASSEILESEWKDYFQPVEKHVSQIQSFQEPLPPAFLAKELNRLGEKDTNFCILVEEELMPQLALGWATALIGELTGGKNRLGACPQTEFIEPEPKNVAGICVLSGPIPGCIVLTKNIVVQLGEYALNNRMDITLSQLIKSYAKQLGQTIIQSKDIGLGSHSTRHLWLTHPQELNIPNRFKLKVPPFPFLKAEYKAANETSAQSSLLFGLSQKELLGNLRFFQSHFLLSQAHCSKLQQNQSDSRPRLAIEFVCDQQTFDTDVQPLLDLANIGSHEVSIVQSSATTPTQFETTIDCNDKPLSKLKEDIHQALAVDSFEKPYFSPESKSINSAILISFSINEKTEKDLGKCVAQLRKHHPGIDIIWVVPSFAESKALTEKHNLRPYMMPLPWINELAEDSAIPGRPPIEFFFHLAKQLSPIVQLRTPNAYPVGLPHYISSLFWWLSRTSFLVFLDLPSPQDPAEAPATIFASLITTLCTGKKFAPPQAPKALSPTGVSGLYLKTCANLPEIDFDQPAPMLSTKSTNQHMLPHQNLAVPKDLKILSPNNLNESSITIRGITCTHPIETLVSRPPELSSHKFVQIQATQHRELLDRSYQYAKAFLAANKWPAYFKGVTIMKEDPESLAHSLFEVELCTLLLTRLEPDSVEITALHPSQSERWKALCDFHNIHWKATHCPETKTRASLLEDEIHSTMGKARQLNGVPDYHPISNAPLVSVIVPTHNRPQLLQRALQSIQNQTISNFEIIVINDGATPVEDVVGQFKSTCRITLINHEKNRGLPAARNTGLRVAIGKFIAYLDDDDIFHPHHLETCTRHLQEKSAKVLYSNAERATEHWEEGKLINKSVDLPYAAPFSLTHLFVRNPWPILALMHERSCLQVIGLQNETLTTHEDWDFNIRLGLCFKVLRIPEITAQFTARNDGSTMTSSLSDDFTRTTDIIYQRYSGIAKHLPYVLELQLQHAAGILSPKVVSPRRTLRSIMHIWQAGSRSEALHLAKEAVRGSNSADAIALSAKMLWEFGHIESAHQLIRNLKNDQIARIVEPAIFVQSLNTCSYQSLSLKFLSKLKRQNLAAQNGVMGKWYSATLDELSIQLREETIESLKECPDNGTKTICTMANLVPRL